MKKYIKLLLILPLLFTVTVNAKVYDLNGGNFENKIYLSGDIYNNVNLLNDYYAEFTFGDYKINYQRFSESNSVGGLIGKIGGIAVDFVPNKYIVNAGSKKSYAIFGVKENQVTDFIIPKILGNDCIWSYHDEYYQSNGHGGYDAKYRDSFEYVSGIPKYSVVCDKNDYSYGEEGNCSIYITMNGFENAGSLFLMMTTSFNLSSEDYKIYDVNINDITGLEYSNGKISGNLFDYNIFKEPSDNASYDYFEKKVRENVEQKTECVLKYGDTFDDNDGWNPGILGSMDPTSCEIENNIFKMKLLDFKISSIHNENKNGYINLSNVSISFSDNGTDYVGFESELSEDTAMVPIIGEVKGVEENPQTGLFNYLLLIIPVALLGIGFNLLRRVNIFKKI
jgi:hypothetical protein